MAKQRQTFVPESRGGVSGMRCAEYRVSRRGHGGETITEYRDVWYPVFKSLEEFEKYAAANGGNAYKLRVINTGAKLVGIQSCLRKTTLSREQLSDIQHLYSVDPESFARLLEAAAKARKKR
jgi:hypothetical protein